MATLDSGLELPVTVRRRHGKLYILQLLLPINIRYPPAGIYIYLVYPISILEYTHNCFEGGFMIRIKRSKYYLKIRDTVYMHATEQRTYSFIFNVYMTRAQFYTTIIMKNRKLRDRASRLWGRT